MGETMRQVITHEIGHALGLQHNMVASSSFPTESLRDPKFTSQYGVSATIMDYARQNYVAQPGDGLQPKDFIRRLGPFDDFAINWGYRVVPAGARREEDDSTAGLRIRPAAFRIASCPASSAAWTRDRKRKTWATTRSSRRRMRSRTTSG